MPASHRLRASKRTKRAESVKSAPKRYSCKCCGVEFPGRHGGNKFHSTDCRLAFHQATQNTRQAKHRLRTRREFVNLCAAGLAAPFLAPRGGFGDAPSRRAEQAAAICDRCGSEILALGLNDRTRRARLRTALLDVSARLSAGNTLDEQVQRVRALELLRDIGTEVPAVAEACAPERYAAEAIQFFEATRDWPELARALLAGANFYRILGNDRAAADRVAYATHLLDERCDGRDPRVLRLQHEAARWNIRLRVEAGTTMHAGGVLARFERLTTEIADKTVALVRHEELAGLLARFGQVDEAREHLAKLDAFPARMLQTPFRYPGVVRSHAEFAFAAGETERAVEEWVPRYARIFRTFDGGAYSWQVLQRWQADYRFSLEPLPPPAYSSSVHRTLYELNR